VAGVTGAAICGCRCRGSHRLDQRTGGVDIATAAASADGVRVLRCHDR